MGHPPARAKETENGDEWISLAEAARRLGQSRLAIMGRALRGEIVAQTVARRTVVRRDSVERLLASQSEKDGGKDVANSRKHDRNPAPAR